MKLNHIYNQNSADLAEIPDNTVDALITSPPYNISTCKSQRAKKSSPIPPAAGIAAVRAGCPYLGAEIQNHFVLSANRAIALAIAEHPSAMQSA